MESRKAISVNIANASSPTPAYNPQVAIAIASLGAKGAVSPAIPIITDDDLVMVRMIAEEEQAEMTARETVPSNEPGANVDLYA